MATRTVSVPAINCGHCVKTIERELGELPGVSSVAADAASKTVTVDWHESETDWPSVRALLVEIGFPPSES